MLAVRLDDVSDVGNVTVALLIHGLMGLIVFGGDAFQVFRLSGGETGISSFGTQLISRFEQAAVLFVLDQSQQ